MHVTRREAAGEGRPSLQHSASEILIRPEGTFADQNVLCRQDGLQIDSSYIDVTSRRDDVASQ